ncbi:hypothetical protein DMC30DRAFT_59317 [Rhodotorula diobovata]|uniref:Uncharacterized protein n=1 Tax=Rhodotorula diobovata TaxID=5288 RepID=A0A5C5FQ10_9BASI|nr:hypothetical protein DMC30DRAFT_59317 [Rhodotorula diobovata]
MGGSERRGEMRTGRTRRAPFISSLRPVSCVIQLRMARTGSSDAAGTGSPTLSRDDRDKLALVLQDLAPPLVLSQPLSTPSAPGPTLLAALSPDAPLPTVHVLRACINEASTSALLAAAMDLANSELDSARLLNDTDDFQRTVAALLDHLEAASTGAADSGATGKRLKRDKDDEAQPPTKTRRYMLHRTLATGVDLFTSSAILSDADLEALAALNDTDLIAVHPPPSSSSSASAIPPPPVPTLGEANPAPPPPAFPPHVPPAARAGRAPGLLKERLEAVSATHPSRQPTTLLSYPSPFLSSLAPSHDSSGATEPYALSAARGLTEGERAALRAVGVDAEVLERALRGGQGGEEGEGEEGVEARLGRNAELIAQVGRAQVVRLRRAARTVEEGARGAGRGKEVGGGEEDAGEEAEEEAEEGWTKAGRKEREDGAFSVSLPRFVLGSASCRFVTPGPELTPHPQHPPSSTRSPPSSRRTPPPAPLPPPPPPPPPHKTPAPAPPRSSPRAQPSAPSPPSSSRRAPRRARPPTRGRSTLPTRGP